jgi:muramidase (phage lysozyme)
LADGTIAEFLVGLGLKIDEAAQNRFQKGVEGAGGAVGSLQGQLEATAKSLQQLAGRLGAAGDPLRKYEEEGRKVTARQEVLRKGAVELGRTAVATATAFAAGIVQVAKNYQQLFYSAQQAQVSAKELGGLEYAFRQIGLGGNEAAAALTAMTNRMKLTPGLEGFLRRMTGLDFSKMASGTGTASERMKEFLGLLDWAAKQTGEQGTAIRAQIGQMFGIGQQQLEYLTANRNQLRKSQEEYDKVIAESGVNADRLAKQSNEFMQQLGGVGLRLRMIWDQATAAVLPAITGILGGVNRLLDGLLKFNNLHPFASIIEELAVLAGGAKIAMGAARGLLRVVGLGGKATAAAGGEAAAGGAAAGVSLLGPAAAVAGAVAGGYELYKSEKETPGRTGHEFEEMVARDRAERAAQDHPQQRGGFWSRLKEALPRFQRGGIVGLVHQGEMVLPEPLSKGLQRLIAVLAGGELGAVEAGDIRVDGPPSQRHGAPRQPARSGQSWLGQKSERAWDNMAQWLQGAGVVPKVEIDNVDDLARAQQSPLARLGQQVGSAVGGAVGRIGGALAGRPAEGAAAGARIGGRVGAAVGGAVEKIAATTAELPKEALAFLNTIAGPESGGRYNVRYTPHGGATFAETGEHPRIYEPGPAGPSSAAGRYQFTASTWGAMVRKYPQLKGFSHEHQDIAAWQLAQENYQKRTHRDLVSDLQSGHTEQVEGALLPTWTGGAKRFAERYQPQLAALERPATTAQRGGIVQVGLHQDEMVLPAALSRGFQRILGTTLGAPPFGNTITNNNGGNRQVTMNVTHNVSISGGGGANPYDLVGRYSGAAKRLYGDLQRNLQTAIA